MHQHGPGTRNDLGTVSVSDGLASPLSHFSFLFFFSSSSSSVHYYYYFLLLLLLLLLSPPPPPVNMHIQVLYSATIRKPSKHSLNLVHAHSARLVIERSQVQIPIGAIM